MGLISKIKEGLSHTSSEEHVATTKTETTIGSEQVVAIPAEVDVVMEDKVVDVPINTYTAEADKTVIQAEAEEVQVKQAEAIVQEKKDVHAEVEITPVVDRVVDETEVRQTILPVKDEVNEVSAEHRVAATDKRSITEAPTDAVKAKYQEQASAVQSSYKEVEGETQVKVNAPVIEEVHKKHIVEEIQPVIERTTHHTHKIHTTQPIEEHVIAAAKVADIQVKAPISMEEFKKSQMGVSATTASTGVAATSTSHFQKESAHVEAASAQRTTETKAAVAAVPVAAVPVAVEIREE